MLGAVILMIVSLVEIVFYITALFASPDVSPMISLNLIYAVQALWWLAAAIFMLARGGAPRTPAR